MKHSAVIDDLIIASIAVGAYVIESDGSLFSIRKGIARQLYGAVGSHGYIQVKLRLGGLIKAAMFHRVVAIALIPNPDNKPTVNHKDGIKSNNNPSNLEWASHSEQELHAHATGLKSFIGSENNFSKLTESNVIAIKRELAKGISGKLIATNFGISRSVISEINTGKIWRHVC